MMANSKRIAVGGHIQGEELPESKPSLYAGRVGIPHLRENFFGRGDEEEDAAFQG